MDIRMPVMDGLEATRQIVAAEDPPRVLMLTTFDLDEYVFDALVAGASGFLLKDVARTAAGGDPRDRPGRLAALPIGHAPADRVLRPRPPRTPQPPPGLDELTARELEILGLIARGLSNAEIAELLVVSGTTVKTHVARVLDKLGLRDRVQAVVLAYETGIIRPGNDRPEIFVVGRKLAPVNDDVRPEAVHRHRLVELRVQLRQRRLARQQHRAAVREPHLIGCADLLVAVLYVRGNVLANAQ
jgi:DNA-binding NarL/FixJ family response regulator